MKKVIMILFVLLLAVGLVACRASITPPTRGEWDEHVFTSEYLGLRFVLPDGWDAVSDADIAATLDSTAELMGANDTEIPDDIELAHDMVASNLFTGTNVQITFRQHGGLRAPTRERVIESVTEELESMDGVDVRITAIPDAIRLGAYDWYSFETEIDIMGLTIFGRQIFNVHEGYIRVITITLMPDDPETIEDVLTNFIGLDDPIPEPPAAQVAEELFDSWSWDMDGDYTYVFHADGTGTRGFSGDIESFEWRTAGDHLMIGMESWTFAIEGDILTIDSRQEAGTTFSYIRESARANLIHEIGDTSIFEQFEVTITDFEITRRFETSTFRFEPNAGNRFAVVHLTLANMGNERETLLRTIVTANDTRATLIHEDGTTLNPVNIHSGRSLLGSRIEAGEYLEGFLVFEIHESIAGTGELTFMLANGGRGSAVRYQIREAE